MYLKTDGSRVTDDADWKSMQYAEVFADRDYRLAQTVISPEYRKYNKAGLLVPTAPNFAVTGTGYQIIKWNIDNEAYEASKISNNSLPIMRYAEVLLNYAEAKAELGEMTDDVWDRTIRLLRERSGVNGDRPATADNYLADYYAQLDGSKISDKDILEVRRERSIELISEGDTHTNRWFDLLRWHLGHKAVKQWYGIYVPALKTPDRPQRRRHQRRMRRSREEGHRQRDGRDVYQPRRGSVPPRRGRPRTSDVYQGALLGGGQVSAPHTLYDLADQHQPHTERSLGRVVDDDLP